MKKKDTVKLMDRLAIAVGAVALLLLAWFLLPRLWSADPGATDGSGDESTAEAGDMQDCPLRRALDGVCVERVEDQQPRLIAVMVENHIEANPLAGLADAAVVYEAPVEGHIPRFLALYPADVDVKKVGPVRSARPYYLDWLAEYPGAMYMHVGGSPEALARIAGGSVFDMNEFSRGWYYWRAENRAAPHNAYTSDTLWRSALQRYGEDVPAEAAVPWQFGAVDVCTEDCVNRIEIGFQPRTYRPEWLYSTSTAQYERRQFGTVHEDESGERYVADTVIVQHVDARVIDAVGRLDIETIGTGEANVFVGGRVIEGTWKKESLMERTRWFNAVGEEVVLKPGKIWIEVATPFVEVAYE